MRSSLNLIMRSFIMILLLISVVSPVEPNRDNRIHSAVNYLISHFDPEVGLIYESEDTGAHWLKRVEYPDYHWRY